MRSFSSLALLGTVFAVLVPSASANTLPLSSSTYAAAPAPGCSGPARPGAASCALERLVPHPSSRAASLAKALAAPASTPAGLSPQTLHTAYNLPSSTPGVSATQTIALIDAYDDPTIEADLETYDAQFGLPPCNASNGCFRRIDEHGGTSYPTGNTSWSSEISLDVQVAHAICTDCHILLVETKSNLFVDLEEGVKAAVALGATEISNSYASPEWKGVSGEGYNYPGVVITASSGDCGYLYTACKGEAPTAGFPASSPDVVGVGGTTLTWGTSGWVSSVWNDGGSGCSEAFTAPAWQSAAQGFSATGCGTNRSGVDVSADGNPFSGAATYNSTSATPGWGVWGGTSEAAPIVAAEYALAGGSHNIAYPAQTLYNHLGNASALLNVTSGFNGSCSTTICQGAIGYNGATGVGSPLGLEAFSVSGAPQSVTPPTVSGPAVNTGTLTGAPGTWSGSPSFSYQWQRSSEGAYANIAGATNSTYVLTVGDVNNTVRLEILATNASGTVVATSAPTPFVATLTPPILGALPPIVKGHAIARQTLTVIPPQVIGSPLFTFTYQWQRSARHSYVTLRGATSPTFLIPSNLVGTRLRVIVTASNAAGYESVASNPTATVKPVGKISKLRLSPTHSRHALITFLDTESGPVILTVLHKGSNSCSKHGSHRAGCNATSAPMTSATAKEASKGKNALRLSSLLGHGAAPAGRYVLTVEALGGQRRVAADFTIH